VSLLRKERGKEESQYLLGRRGGVPSVPLKRKEINFCRSEKGKASVHHHLEQREKKRRGEKQTIRSGGGKKGRDQHSTRQWPPMSTPSGIIGRKKGTIPSLL